MPFFDSAHLDPASRMEKGVGEEEAEHAILEQLPRCLRLWHDDNNTGGFFVAQFRHKTEASPESVAQAFRSRRAKRKVEGWTPTIKAPPKPTSNSVIVADTDVVNHLEDLYGMALNGYSLWQRGKRLNLAPPLVHERLYKPPSPTNKGDVWGGDSFHPIRVVHAGLPAFTLKKNSWRSRQEALYAFAERFERNVLVIDEAFFVRLLRGWAPLVEDFCEQTKVEELPKGAFLLRSTLPWGCLLYTSPSPRDS